MKIYYTLPLVWLISCIQPDTAGLNRKQVSPHPWVNPHTPMKIENAGGMILEDRFYPPPGFDRVPVEEGSWAAYLRKLPLKRSGAKVHYYNGAIKPSHGVYRAVVDMPIGDKDLHQCADAVIHLRADYLYKKQAWEAIHFNFTNGFRADYAEWRKGKRISVSGNSVHWREGDGADSGYEDFQSYLETVYRYAGTLSLSKELMKVKVADMEPGDVFIRGGSPGHAVIVVDMAVDSAGTRKLFMLAQSYMPAQDIQILENPNDTAISPWYSLDFGTTLVSPEWIFSDAELKRFPD